MTSRPHDLVRRLPADVAATFMARRPPTASERNPAGWRTVRWQKRHAHTSAMLDHAAIAAGTSAPLTREFVLAPKGSLTSKRPHADLADSLEPLGLPAMPGLQDSNSRWRTRSIATWEKVSYVGRLVTFNLTVAILHLAILRWVLLRIGG